jgi:adenylate cyclase class 2
MAHVNIEIKARCNNSEAIRTYLQSNNADFIGTDVQTDTYFKTNNGRLKLREGNIENNLIYYERDNQAGPKSSDFILTKIPDAAHLKESLLKAMGVKVIVKKKREIYYINNVKFHIDEVEGLGSFAEIEAGNIGNDLTKDELLKQCEYYMQQFGIEEKDLIEVSYSDMMLAEISEQ